MRIRADPERLRVVARELRMISDDLLRLAQRVGGAAGGLDWETRQSLGVDGHAANARQQARLLADRAEAMSRWLAARARAFEEADVNGATRMERLLRTLPLPKVATPLPSTLPRLGWPFPSVQSVRLPLLTLPLLVQPLLDWGRVQRWFKDRLRLMCLSLPTARLVPSPRPIPSIYLPGGREVPLAELGQQYPLGMSPVAAVTELRRQYPVSAEITSSPALRQRELYDAAINQFGVDSNPRYVGSKAYCNIFVSDVTRAMSVEIPHWVDKDGHAVQFGGRAEPGWRELNVQGMRAWLQGEGSSTWRRVSAEEAQREANSGRPVVVLDSGGTHIGIVRPGKLDSTRGPALAQAGKENFGDGNALDGFGAVESDYQQLEYYVAS
jgi:hypothetical protein